MQRHIVSVLLWLVPVAVIAQQSPVLRNSGEPIRLPFTCAEDELQSVGLLCTEDEPWSVFLELSTVASAGKKLFIAGNLHSTSATLSSILLASDDGGATWKEPSARVRGASLDQLEFYDLDHGWAGGELQYPLSRDPFFLISTDGGATWRKRQVSEDGGPGSVQRFWFDSPQHGELIVDAGRSAPGGRYLDWESETGGESWMIRSATGAAPKIKHAPPAFDNPDFRLRSSANGQAYQVEKRLGEKWEPMASFLIEIASCKMKAQELKEPPPEPITAEPQPEKDYVEQLQLGGGKAPAVKAPSKPPAKPPAHTPPVKKDPPG
ncbi:MAG: hypothetical protein QOH67_5173 [Hyphomicrobiales bacterium]|nr:hypothetical protein [Hyphomicrobiales bacterium]